MTAAGDNATPLSKATRAERVLGRADKLTMNVGTSRVRLALRIRIGEKIRSTMAPGISRLGELDNLGNLPAGEFLVVAIRLVSIEIEEDPDHI